MICEGGEAGRAAVWELDDIGIKFQKAIHRVRVPNEIDSKFLVHRLKYDYFNGSLNDYYTGVTIKHLTGQDLHRYEILLPPRSEQRKIAAILDQAEHLRRKRRTALEYIDRLKSNLFIAQFGNPAINDRKWPLGTIGDITESTQYGTSFPAGEVGKLPILRMGNITYSGDIDCSNLKFIDLPARDVEKHTVRAGGILFNRTNSPDLVGKTAIYKGIDIFAYAGYLVRVRTGDKSDPEYISGFLNSGYGKATLRGMCKTIIGMANINAKEMASISIPVPPLDLQRAFAARVAEIDKLKALHRAHLAKLDELFASLQHRAFRGEL